MASQTKISIQDLHLHYGDFEALKGITMEIPSHEITAFIGPVGLRQIHLYQDPQPDE